MDILAVVLTWQVLDLQATLLSLELSNRRSNASVYFRSRYSKAKDESYFKTNSAR